MQIQSLAELKAENELKAKKDAKPEQENAELEVLDSEESEGENEVIEANADDETNEPDETLESWQTDESGETENDAKTLPVSAHVKMKAKLKGRLAEKDSEVERLKAENEALKKGQLTAKPETTLKPRPKLEDFGFDDEKYQAALDKWDDERLDYKLNKYNQVNNQKTQLSQMQKTVETAVEQHYERAAILATKSKIAPEVYQAADMQFRQTIDDVFPGRGDAIADHLISTIGKDSEKVAYYIGRNGNAQKELKEALLSDPSGVKAAIWIGRKTAELMKSKGSQAPNRKPAPVLNGDSSANGSVTAKKLKAEYEDAHNKGNTQKAYNMRKKAKEAGIDTKNW